MVAAIREAGIPASVSNTAGTYVCNHLMYGVLYTLAKKYPGVRGGFIHVPYVMCLVVEKPMGTCAMSTETIAKGLELAIKAIVENKQDINLRMGTLM